MIDANSLVYRAFFAVKAALSTSGGQPTNAVFGFARMLRRILEEVEPEYAAACFDVGKVTHRTEKFAAYKQHRPPMPDSLASQLTWIRDLVRAYRLALFEKEGFEADDVIATLVHRMGGKFRKVVIISGDKDILQLVGGNVEVYNPYKEEGLVYTAEVVEEKMGVAPGRIRDLIALMGDASDGIPGVKGVGEKTALLLLKEFKDVDDLLKHRDRIKREGVRRALEEGEASLTLSRELAILRTDVPLDADVEGLKVREPDTAALWDLYSRLEFRGMLKELARQGSGPQAAEAPAPVAVATACAGDITAQIAGKKAFGFFFAEGEAAQLFVALDGQASFRVEGIAEIKKIFSQAGCLAVGFDTKACRHRLAGWGIAPDVAFFDVMLAAYLVTSAKGSFDLPALVWNYLDRKGAPQHSWAGQEAALLMSLKPVLEHKLEEAGLTSLFADVEMPLERILFVMERCGVALDGEALAALAREIDGRLKDLIKKIFDAAGSTFNINSPKQLSEVLFQRLKLPVVKKTKTGFSTDEEVLTRLARQHELPQALLEYRQLTKLKTTYVDVLPGLADTQGRIHGSFNQTGTETGRLSSSEPNLQNIPVKTPLGRRIREAFVPGKGFASLLSADYSQIELRVLAHLSGDEVLGKAFREDADVHRFTASLIFSTAEADVTEEMRENAKRVNFGIVYGMSGYGLAKDLGIDPRTAEAFIEEYFLRYPRVRDFLTGQIEHVREHGYVTTLLGRRRYIPEVRNKNLAVRQFAERQAVNAPIQGSAADIIKVAMVRIDGRLREEGLRSRLVLQVHDELVFEVAKEEEGLLPALVRREMEGAFELRVPLKVTLKAGANWSEMREIG
ncbi:MAG: DNA polymerase I [Deltaproteobacteria bacterium]